MTLLKILHFSIVFDHEDTPEKKLNKISRKLCKFNSGQWLQLKSRSVQNGMCADECTSAAMSFMMIRFNNIKHQEIFFSGTQKFGQSVLCCFPINMMNSLYRIALNSCKDLNYSMLRSKSGCVNFLFDYSNSPNFYQSHCCSGAGFLSRPSQTTYNYVLVYL